jgi:hypothetical protein
MHRHEGNPGRAPAKADNGMLFGAHEAIEGQGANAEGLSNAPTPQKQGLCGCDYRRLDNVRSTRRHARPFRATSVARWSRRPSGPLAADPTRRVYSQLARVHRSFGGGSRDELSLVAIIAIRTLTSRRLLSFVDHEHSFMTLCASLLSAILHDLASVPVEIREVAGIWFATWRRVRRSHVP